MATKQRSILKSLTWRIIAFFITFTLAMLMLKDTNTSLILSVAIHSINTLVYYFHERLWNRVEWGKIECKHSPHLPHAGLIGALLHPWPKVKQIQRKVRQKHRQAKKKAKARARR